MSQYNVAYGQIPLTANGNVSPRRFIVPVASAGNGQRAVQASGSTLPYLGISQDWTRFPPGSAADDGYIAIAGEPLPYAGPGMTTNLDIGATCANCTVPVKSDGSGKGTPMLLTGTTAEWVGALLWRTAVADEVVPVLVLSPFRHFPALS